MNTERGFTLHPGAAQDITDSWEFVLEDNPLAARRVREDILDAIRKLVPFPEPRTQETGPHHKALAVPSRTQLHHRLRTRRKAACGARRAAWSPQSSRNGSLYARKRVSSPYLDAVGASRAGISSSGVQSGVIDLPKRLPIESLLIRSSGDTRSRRHSIPGLPSRSGALALASGSPRNARERVFVRFA
jgi:plasmid stabilization system protein ParE